VRCPDSPESATFGLWLGGLPRPRPRRGQVQDSPPPEWGTRFKIRDAQNTVPGSVYRPSMGSWFVVRGSWFVVRGSWFVVRGSWFVVGRDSGVIP